MAGLGPGGDPVVPILVVEEAVKVFLSHRFVHLALG